MREDYEWYKDNLDQLYKEFGSSIIAIKNKRVIGSYDNFKKALEETGKTEEEGSFILQRCGIGESSYTNYIASVNFT